MGTISKGEISIKKIAIISLSLVLLVSQFSFAMDFSESSLNEQETAEEVLMSTPDEIDIQALPSIPGSPLCDMLITTCIQSMLAMDWGTATISYILWAVFCYPVVEDD
jgi:hypothetical protein